jgi:formylmethanofuran dehydrogenase subunit E
MLQTSIENPRREIEKAIAAGDLKKLLLMNGMLHGHFCHFSAMGVKAAALAVNTLGVKSTGMEEVVAIVETNSCFADGIQFTTGCSLGNNALIYRDFGKTAFTLAKRSGEGIRIAVIAERVFQERSAETNELFDKVIINHCGTDEEQKRLHQLWAELSFNVLKLPNDEVFKIEKRIVDLPSYARIFASVKCCICGESIMEPRARLRDGQSICLPCSGQEYYQLAGDGLSIITPKTQ